MAGLGRLLDRGGSPDIGQPSDGIVADGCLLSDSTLDRDYSDGLFGQVSARNWF